MRPADYEQLVAQHLREEGYTTELTAATGDYGVDVIATKGGVRLAVQVKMYGGSQRQVNRAMVMELAGARQFFECTAAMLVTDGGVLPDARDVARKLGIVVRHLPAVADSTRPPADDAFCHIWEQYIMPLAGQTLRRPDGETNTVVRVDWSGLERVTSSGARQQVGIEIFRWAVRRLLAEGSVTRDAINQEYPKRASSGIVLILSQIPFLRLERLPGLRLVLDRNALPAEYGGTPPSAPLPGPPRGGPWGGQAELPVTEE